jgi:hypothetical protein
MCLAFPCSSVESGTARPRPFSPSSSVLQVRLPTIPCVVPEVLNSRGQGLTCVQSSVLASVRALSDAVHYIHECR